MIAPDGTIVHIEDDVVGRIVDHADFLENHLPLEGQIGLTQQRLEDQLPDDRRGLWEMFIENAGLVRRVFTLGVRIE